MRKDKLTAFKLRKDGKTYNEIKTILGVSKGTLSFWFSKFDWSKDFTKLNHTFNYSPEKVRLMHQARKSNLENQYKRAESETLQEFERYRDEPLFIAGLMLYAGEGDRSPNNSQVRLGNVDYRIILTFKRFISTYYPEFIPRMRVSMLLYPDLDKDECVQWWRQVLQDEEVQFYTPIVIQGRHKTRRLQHGVAGLIISSKFLKIKVLRSIDLAFKNELRA